MSAGLLPLPATLNQIIPNLMVNLERIDADGTKTVTAFSRLVLSDSQKSQLSYPETMDVLDEYFLQENITNDVANSHLLSFTRIRDYIYGVYFVIDNFEPYNFEEMSKSKTPLNLPDSVKFNSEFYLEFYFDIDGLIILNGFVTDTLVSAIQYMQDGKFYIGAIDQNGILPSHFTRGTNHVIGLSRNLRSKCNEIQRDCSKGYNSYIPPPASLKQTLLQVFSNTKNKSREENGGIFFTYWSRCLLSEEQKSQITYPPNFKPLNFYVYEQYTNSVNSEIEDLSIAVFAENNGYLYGLYYRLDGQSVLPVEKLVLSENPIKIDPKANLTKIDYIECYFKVKTCKNKRVIIDGLSYRSDNQYSTLQYSDKKKFYFAGLRSTGTRLPSFIYNPDNIIGVSENLKISC